MATPRAAQHRDLEQRIRDLEQQVRALTSATLRREQLSVEQGDFVVSGGGGVVVRDGGGVVLYYPDNTPAVVVGDVGLAPDGSDYGSGLMVWNDTGTATPNQALAFMGHRDDGGAEVELFDRSGNRVLAVDGASGFGLALPHLNVPMYPDNGNVQIATTTSSGFTSLYFGTFEVVSPYLDVACYAYSNSSTDCDVRFTLDGAGNAAGGGYERAAAGSGVALFTWRIDLTGYPHGSQHELRLECRGRNGSQSVGAMPYYVRGGQS